MIRMLICPIVVILLAAQVAGFADSPQQPNILFIFADDWGWGDLSCHGSDIYQTPNLDKLAAQGTDFHRFTVASGVCSPSRAAVMTGHYPARYSIHRHFHHVQHHRRSDMPDWLPPEGVMLPRLLKEAGYATAHYGKWHLTNTAIDDAPHPKAYGYDDSAVFNGPGPQVNADPTHDAPLSTDKAIEFIRRHRDQPWFVNLWVHATHTPHYPTQRWLRRFDHLDQQQRVYAAVVAETDERIGQVLAVLDELDLADDTLVIFSSDNGPEHTGKRKRMGDASTGGGLGNYFSVGTTGGLRGQKRSLYDGGVGVPLIVRWPGVTPTGRVDRSTVITGVDLLPTFCAVAGVPLPDGYQPDGVNVLPALRGEPFERTRMIFWEWRGGHGGTNWPALGVQDGMWKLLVSPDAKRVALYNLANDRDQSSNRAPHEPGRVKRMMHELRAWKRSLPTSPPRQAFSALRQSAP